MKNRAILLLLGLIISSSYVFSQVSKDTLQEDSIYPQFYGYFSAEESWQIHKEAYRKQLEAKGLSENEINKKMQEYEKQKEELIEKINEQRKLAEKQRQLAEIQRQKAGELRKWTEVQRQEAEKQRQKADELRKQADIQRQKADEHRKLTEIQRQKADEQRKEAETQRKVAEEQRKIAEDWRNSIQNLLNENFTISGKDSEIKAVKIKVIKKNTLFFNINGDINSGNVLIEIFNPNGKKEGELSLENRKESTLKTESRLFGNTSGSLNKTINSPEIGDWLVKITPEKSNGNINVSVAQFIKPAIDE